MSRVVAHIAAPVTCAAALCLCAGPQEAALAAPVPTPVSSEDRAAASVFSGLHSRLFGGPFFAVAILSIRRPGVSRNLIVRLYYRDSRRSLLRLDGSPREAGTIVLKRDSRIYLFFPRADLLLNLPASMGADRLFGSDFSVDDLLSLGAASSRFTVTFAGEENMDGLACLRFRLVPRASSSPYAEVRLWVARADHVPVRLEYVSAGGEVLREVTVERSGEIPLPARWKARTFGPGGGESSLDFRFFERNPPVGDDLFTVERIRQWR